MTDWPAFAQLPDEAQLWVFGFKEKLDQKHGVVREALEHFMPQWASHGAPVDCAFQLLHDRFVLVAAICQDGVSGCSIDSCVRVFKQLRDVAGLDGLDRSLVFYRDPEGSVQAKPFLEFRQLSDAGVISSDSRVFDTTIVRLGDLRAGKFELAFRDCWHAQSFPLPSHAQ